MSLKHVTDLYEASFLVAEGFLVEGVECIPIARALACRFSFREEEGFVKAQTRYYAKSACVNIHAFRAAYNQINNFVHVAKKSYEKERKEKTAGGEA